MLNIGIIGAGNIAKYHAKAILDLKDRLKLKSIYNWNLDKALSFKDHILDLYKSNINAYDDLDLMLDKENLDLVIICTPHKTHIDLATKVIERNIHVLIEKPLDISYDKALNFRDFVMQHKAHCSLVSQTRFYEASKRIKRYLKEKDLGEVALAHVQVALHRDKDYYMQNAWRGTLEFEGGGVLLNQAVHELDLLCYFIDSDIDKVYGLMRNINHPYIDVEDSATINILFKNKAIATVLATTACNIALSSYVQITTTKGYTLSIITQANQNTNAGTSPSTFAPFNNILTCLDDKELFNINKKDKDNFIDSFSYLKDELINFIDFIEGKDNLIVTLDSALRPLKIIDEVYKQNR